MSSMGLLRTIVDCFEELNKAIVDTGVKKSLRARARNMAADIYYQGVAYTIAVCAARSRREAVEWGLFSEGGEDIVKGVSKYIAHEDREGLSYAIYGATILYLLKQLGFFERAQSLEEVLREALEKAHLINERAGQVALWIKRLAEASFPVEE